MPTLGEDLPTRSDSELAHLLAGRPDLAVPAPSSLAALATRAGTRISVERALSTLSRAELAAAEALVALADATGRLHPVPLAALEAGLGVDPSPVLDRLRDLALVLVSAEGATPIPALTGAFGTYPAGLGPSLAVLDALHPADRVPSSPTTAPALRSLLADAPDGARRILDALTWGQPVGTVDPADPGPGPTWLLDRGILRRLSPHQLVLPREVALAARAGRLVRDAAPQPPQVEAPCRPGAVVGAESAAAADRVVRHVEHLLETWDDTPPAVLRAGGLTVRELRRLAARLGASNEETSFVAEVAAAAGLIAPWSGGEAPTCLPTDDGDRWLALDLAERWAWLADAWWSSTRASWLVGTRDAKDSSRAPLGAGLDRAWAPGLRRRVLAALAGLAEGVAPSAEQVHEVLAWWAPRSTPTTETVESVLREAAWLGITGAGALSGAGRALAGCCGPPSPGLGDPSRAGHGPASEGEQQPARRALEAALEADLPPVVEDLVVQADLTGLVPGRPSRDLGELLEACAEVESRGSALTVRFTGTSVARALDAGLGAEDLVTRLRRHARTGLPQPLEYLVADEARRHGAVRVGPSSSYVRSDDAAWLAGLASNPRLAHVHLRALAPTVLVSPEPAAAVLAALREAGAGAVLEGQDGLVVTSAERARRPRSAGSRRGEPGVGHGPAGLGAHERAAIVQRMRAGDAKAAAERLQPGAGSSPVVSLALLQEAADAGTLVTLCVAGPTGAVERRVVRPISVDAGRVRVVDVARLAELTVAVHRIIEVGPPVRR